MSDYLGRFLWYELLAADPDRAKAFYSELIGWGTEPFGTGPMPYTLWKHGDVPIGGMMALPEEVKKAGVPSHWLAYVGTPSVDTTVSKATGLGAKTMVPPTDIPEVGRFAVLQDPQGAGFALYTPKGDPGPECSPESGMISWHELMTTDHGAAFDFYSALFGWKKGQAMDMGPAGIYQLYGRTADAHLGGMFNKPPDVPGPPYWLLYVSVADVNESVERVKHLGGQVLNGPMEVPGGDLIAQCLDSQGAAFALHSKAKS